MTREAKIGMLTGLFVIVLIGVLLSEYLGDASGQHGTGITASAGTPTGKMAPLPIGEGYRQQVMSSGGVAGMARGTGTEALAGGTEITPAIETRMGMVAFAAEGSNEGLESSGPRMGVPVKPVPAGAAQTGGTISVPPTFVMAANTKPPVAGASTPAKASGATYEIVAGDSLAKIAKKFYGSAKNSDIERIVAANPDVLKDATTKLVVKKKLLIPNVSPAAAAVEPVNAKSTGVPIPGNGPGRIELPKGGAVAGGAKALEPKPADASKKDTIYSVQAGDTLEKIAKKLSPTKSAEMVQKLMAANGIKDPHDLKAGAKLRVPA